MRKLLILTCCFAQTAHAQDTMNAAEFDAHVTGRTITFLNESNTFHGVERYLEGRRVMWSGVGDICKYGVWYESKGDICFLYEDDSTRHCWTTYDEPGGIRGVYTTNAPFSVIFEAPEIDTPLVCNDLSS